MDIHMARAHKIKPISIQVNNNTKNSDSNT